MTETLITGSYSYPRTQYIIDYPGPWYIVFDHRPKGGRTPDPGSTVTLAWDDFQWFTNLGDPWPFTPSCTAAAGCRFVKRSETLVDFQILIAVVEAKQYILADINMPILNSPRTIHI